MAEGISIPRYIDANKLREEWLYNTIGNENIYCPNDVLDSIDEQPDCNVEPVIHAKWKQDGDYWEQNSGNIYCSRQGEYLKYVPNFLKCTNCKFKNKSNVPYKRCPDCGAIMDKE